VLSGGQQHRVGQRAAQPRLVALGQHVAAHVDERDQVGAQSCGGIVQGAGHALGARPRVDEQDPLVQDARQAGLGEVEVAGAGRLRGGAGDGVVERLGVAQLVQVAGAGHGIDHPSLPGQAADDPLRAEALGQVGHHQGADAVAATADADAEDARGVPEDLFEAQDLRRAPVRGRR